MGLLHRPGLRLAIEAVAIVLAALVSGLLHLDAWAIAAAVAVVWVLAAIIEYSLGHRDQRRRRPAARPAPRAAEPQPAVEPEPEPEPEPVPLASEGVRVIRRAQPAPVPVQPEPEPEPEAVAVQPQPEPEPEPVAAEPEPQPEPEPEPEPAPAPAAVIPAEPRRWSIWDLERALREGSGASEEAEYMLLYLRDFADAEGLLPLDFDGLVRESFGDALAAVA